MTIVSRATAQSYFQTGDRPSQQDFTDTLDSTLFKSDDMSTLGQQIVSAGTASSARTVLGAGTVGSILFTVNTTASGQNQLGAGTVGVQVFQSATTAAAQGALGGGSAGIGVFQATTTAAALNVLGGGTVGIQIFSAVTTASATNIFTIPVAATQSDQETGTSTTVFVNPGVQQYHQSAAKAWVNFDGTTGTINTSYNVTSIVVRSTGTYNVRFTTVFSSGNYVAALSGVLANATSSILNGSDTATSVSAAGFELLTYNNPNTSLGNITRVWGVFYGDQ